MFYSVNLIVLLYYFPETQQRHFTIPVDDFIVDLPQVAPFLVKIFADIKGILLVFAFAADKIIATNSKNGISI